jgi:hypothetical protein
MAQAELPFGVALENVWADYRRCAARSRALKQRLDAIRLWALALFIGGAALGVLSAQLALPDALIKVLALVSAAAIALSAYLTAQALDAGVERGWIEARSVAEGLKSEAYRFLAKAPPYDAADASARLAETVRALRLRLRLGEFAHIDEAERLANLPRNWLGPDEYVQQRVRDQIGYFERRAAEHARKAQQLKLCTIGLGAIGVLLAAAHGVYPQAGALPAWLGVIGTVSGAITTYLFANRLLFLTVSYETTALRLTFALEDWSRLPKEDQAAAIGALVGKVEDILLLENRQWVAEFDRPPEKPAAGSKPPGGTG